MGWTQTTASCACRCNVQPIIEYKSLGAGDEYLLDTSTDWAPQGCHVR